MEEWINHKIIMLPAARAEECIILDFHSLKVRGFMFWMDGFLTNSYCVHSEYCAYHLYILSNAKPCIGDYVVTSIDSGKTKTIIKVTDDSGVYNGFCKVVATTDPILKLPKLPAPFIKNCIDSYNLDKVIYDILVLYYDSKPFISYNFIRTSPAKTSWDRQEVIQKLYGILKATGSEIHAEMKGIGTPNVHIEYSGTDIETWISKNL